MFVHSPPDRPPHLIMLFCFLISRNAKCLCHLWTAKRANLGFSLIATVTSLLRLRWGWVEGMAGGELEDGGMEGWRRSSPHTRAEVWKNAAGQQNAAWRSPTAGSGGQPALRKSPNTQLRGRRMQLWASFCTQKTLRRELLHLVEQLLGLYYYYYYYFFPDTDTCYCLDPTQCSKSFLTATFIDKC